MQQLLRQFIVLQLYLIGLSILGANRFAAILVSLRNKKFKLVLIPLYILAVFYGSLASIAAAPAEYALVSGEVIIGKDINKFIAPVGVPVRPSPMLISEFNAVITQYSYVDSCHNIVDGKCLMASGRPVYEGAVACPYFLPLGSKVVVDGRRYTCEDRYAVWVDTKRGLPTIDVFVSSFPRGRAIKTVAVFSGI